MKIYSFMEKQKRVYPYGTEFKIFRKNLVTVISIDALAPCVTMPSAVLALPMQNKRVLFLSKKYINTLRPRQNGRYFPDDILKCIFFNKKTPWTLIKISLKFVSNGPINNIPALVPIMAGCRASDKPLSEPMMVRLPTHICVTRPQWALIEHVNAACKCILLTKTSPARQGVKNGIRLHSLLDVRSYNA